MGLPVDFFYMELLKHKTQGTYLKSSGIKVYEKYGLDIAVFISMDYRHSCLVQRYYGTYSVIEA